jgi:hypothetical protein
MAKKHDFIERENRTTIAGIIGIVAIVLLIASYMKIQEVAFFAPEENTVGMAAESFLGVRYVQLAEHEALVAHVSAQGLGSRSYYIYPDSNLLVIDYGDRYEQIVLAESNGQLSGSYSDGGVVRLLINPSSAQLFTDGLVPGLPPLSLTTLHVYDGTLSVAGTEYYFRLLGNELLITYDAERAVVLLGPNEDGLLSGLWDDREILVNAADQTVIVHDIY